MDSSVLPSRRQVIVGVGAGALALAGCTTTEQPQTGQPPASQPQSSQPPASQPQSGQSSRASEAPEGGAALIALADIKVGESKVVKADSGEIAVCRTSETEVIAFSAICTHKGCVVEPSGQELKCPCHGSRFNTTDGGVLAGPADTALPKVDVHVKDGNVVAGSA